MNTPVIALNFKVYAESAGKKGFELSEISKKLAEKSGKSVIVAPQFADLSLVCSKLRHSAHFSVFAQHFDPNPQGAFTGTVPAEALLASGCRGSLLNHSERKIKLQDLEISIKKARSLGLGLIVCADDVKEAKAIAELHPPCIAVEPPELIGSGISVSTAKPSIVSDSVREIKRIGPAIKVLVGAGVSNAADVCKSIELGAEGVLLASAFVKSRNPGKLLGEMLEALQD